MGLEDDSRREVIQRQKTWWRYLTLALGAGAFVSPILSVDYAIQGENSLSNVLVALMVVCMVLFVSLQFEPGEVNGTRSP